MGASGAKGPSVIQLQVDRLAVDVVGRLVNGALLEFGSELAAGALLTLDAARLRVRLLPINRPESPSPTDET